jgi:hypothetical protein
MSVRTARAAFYLCSLVSVVLAILVLQSVSMRTSVVSLDASLALDSAVRGQKSWQVV